MILLVSPDSIFRVLPVNAINAAFQIAGFLQPQLHINDDVSPVARCIHDSTPIAVAGVLISSDGCNGRIICFPCRRKPVILLEKEYCFFCRRAVVSIYGSG